MLQISRTGCVIRENPLKLWKRRRKASGIHPRPLSPTHRIGNPPDRQEFYSGVRKSASNSGDERSGPFRRDGLDAGASQRRGVNLVRFAEIVSLLEQVLATH